MASIQQQNLNKTATADKYEIEAIKHFTEIVASLSEENKKQFSAKLKTIASSTTKDQILADAIAGKTYSAEEVKELKLLNLINSFS